MDKSEYEPAAEFRKRLKALRESKHGWTQADLAAAADVSVVTISKLEQGVNLPTFAILTALCDALAVSPNDLIGWPGSKGAETSVVSERELRMITAARGLTPAQFAAFVEFAEKFGKH
ncbi:helix-turn-helix transcriptional regulator [Devosia sp. 2618]|uniref:helix-turn-helix domain-containing protein n=1 Tax=Devosia sp. 2618 TaxID=3156454 RepID=UPI00339709A3